MRALPSHTSTVLAALRFRNARPDLLREVRQSEWNEVLQMCDRMRLTLPLGQVCYDQLPESARQRIDINIRDNSRRIGRICGDYSEVSTLLENAGVNHVLLKGFTLWPDFVQSAKYRTQGDIDLFLPPSDLTRGHDVLKEAGYEPMQGVEHMPTDHLPPMMRKTEWTWRENYYDPELPVAIELHFRFWNASTTRLRPLRTEEFWSRRVKRNERSLTFWALDPVDNIGYAALHVLHHLLFGGLVPYHVYELAYLLHTTADDERFWKTWQVTHGDSLRRMEAVSYRLASYWFACKMPEPVEEEMRALSPTVQQWFEDYGQSPIHALGRPNKDRLWLHLSLLESARDKSAVFCDTVLPVRLPPLKTVGQWSLLTLLRFIGYALSRFAHHLASIPATFVGGIRWWGRTKNLDRQFWTFYGASFCFDLGMFVFFFLFNLYLLDCGST